MPTGADAPRGAGFIWRDVGSIGRLEGDTCEVSFHMDCSHSRMGLCNSRKNTVREWTERRMITHEKRSPFCAKRHSLYATLIWSSAPRGICKVWRIIEEQAEATSKKVRVS